MSPRKKREASDPSFPGFIREIRLDRRETPDLKDYPCSPPVVKSLDSLTLPPKVTFFAE